MTNVGDQPEFENLTKSHESEDEDENVDLDTSLERPEIENDNTNAKVPSVQHEKSTTPTTSASTSKSTVAADFIPTEPIETQSKPEGKDAKISDQIGVAFKELLDPKMIESNDFFQEITTVVAKKVVKFLEDQKNKKDEKFQDFWKEYDNYYVCIPCTLNYKRQDVPAEYVSSRKKGFGIIHKETKDSKQQKSWHVTRSKNYHCEIPLHDWCVEKYLQEKDEKQDHDKANKLAGDLVISNAILCLQRSFGAEDFVAMNAKDNFCNKNIKYVATKNDSRAEFFKLRNVIFDIVSDKTKKFFEDIRDISVTLDKGVKYLLFFSSGSLKMREKIYQFCSVCIFFEGSMFIFQFYHSKIEK